MNKAQVIQLVAVAVSCFPSYQERDMDMTATAWYAMLKDLDYPLAEAALQKVIATAKFFPTVAEIREAATSLTPSELPEAEAAWEEFIRAVQKVGYYRVPEWSHPVIGQCVKAMYGTWQQACGTLQTDTLGVDRAQFLKMYQTMTKREKEMLQLPPAVREFAALAGGALRLPEKAGN